MMTVKELARGLGGGFGKAARKSFNKNFNKSVKLGVDQSIIERFGEDTLENLKNNGDIKEIYKGYLKDAKPGREMIGNLVEGGVNIGANMGAGMAVGGVVGGVVGGIDENSSVGEGIARGIGFGALGGLGTGIGVALHNKGVFKTVGKIAKRGAKDTGAIQDFDPDTLNSIFD